MFTCMQNLARNRMDCASVIYSCGCREPRALNHFVVVHLYVFVSVCCICFCIWRIIKYLSTFFRDVHTK